MEEAFPRVLSALGIVVGALLLLRAGFARFGSTAPQRRLRIVESCALGVRQRLHLVEADGELLVLGVSQDSIRLVRRLPPRASEEASEEAEHDDAPAGAGGLARKGLRIAGLLALLAGLLMGDGAAAQTSAAADSPVVADLASAMAGATDPENLGSTIHIVLLLTLVSVAPSILLMMTCFTRVLIVLSFLRQAIGVQQLPPNQVLAGLALFVTLFVMAPVGHQVYADAVSPYIDGSVDETQALELAEQPIREFLMGFTRDSDLALFSNLAGAPEPENLDEVPLWTLVPAYMLSELRTAFEIGFMIYLPFLVVDLLVASMLISMGMLVLPPIVISLPFKLMLFVLLDGWNLVVGSLVAGLGGG